MKLYRIKGGELHEVMDCLLDYRSHSGRLIPLVLTRDTRRDSSFAMRNIFTHVRDATDDG
jgi:hypothetical protein